MLNNSVGVGLRQPHHQYVLNNKPKVDWFEVHSENFFVDGGPSLALLRQIRQDYPISLHGVGLSLGSFCGIDDRHLKQLKSLIKNIQPFLVSDHISWSNLDNQVLNDLLPIPYNREALKIISANVAKVQDFLQRPILVENPSTYLQFTTNEMTEEQFINQLVKASGCKLLLDVNNVYVSSKNNNFDPLEYLQNLDFDIVGEIHLAGHSIKRINGENLLIDTHNSMVCDDVWRLYDMALKKFRVPTLIEWDQDIPEFEVLLVEAKKAEKFFI